MSYQHKPDSGSLFRNDKKESDKHPDYKGDALIDGREFWLSAWINEGKNGKYMSVKFNEKQAAHEPVELSRQLREVIDHDGVGKESPHRGRPDSDAHAFHPHTGERLDHLAQMALDDGGQ